MLTVTKDRVLPTTIVGSAELEGQGFLTDVKWITAGYALTVLVADFGSTTKTSVLATGRTTGIPAADFSFAAFGRCYGILTALAGRLVVTAQV